MQREVLISGGDRLRRWSIEENKVIAETTLEGGGALCVCGGMVFAAGELDGAIYRFDDRLLISGIYAGGPGMCAMCASADAQRLYVLLADANSVLMLHASDGMPMILAHAGIHPRRMHMDDVQGTLVIAGGEDGCVRLLCPQTLRLQRAIREDGVCCDAMTDGDRVFMLMRTPTLGTRLILHGRAERREIALRGMPGTLCMAAGMLLVSAGKWLYTLDPDTLRLRHKVFGASYPGKLIGRGEQSLLLCPASETLYIMENSRRRLLCQGARDAAFCE